jgi:hypothetical protein
VVVSVVVVVVVQKMKVREKENVKVATGEMRAAEFYFLINNKSIIYEIKSFNFTLKQGD